MMKAEIHRILQNPIYVGDFRWLGRLHRGSHEPLVSREQFAAAQSILGSKPRIRYPKQKHAFMGLLTCARCGCTITERKKGKYVYCRCTGFHGPCGNTYIREEQLASLLGTVVERIHAERVGRVDRRGAPRHPRLAGAEPPGIPRPAHPAPPQRAGKAGPGGIDDHLDGRISEAFWSRKSAEWESELAIAEL